MGSGAVRPLPAPCPLDCLPTAGLVLGDHEGSRYGFGVTLILLNKPYDYHSLLDALNGAMAEKSNL